MADADTCSYAFGAEELQALWLEFQKEGGATCPETGAPIELHLDDESGNGEPSVSASCERCGRTKDFKPGPLEGFGWAE